MSLDQTKHQRRSIRLQGYDYAQAGAYFITICTQDRACLFGNVVDGYMQLNEAGRMIRSVWDEIAVFYPGVESDEFVVMPDHIHGIIVLVGATPRGRPGTEGPAPTLRPQGQAQGPAPTGPAPTLRPQGQAQGPAPTGPAPTLSLPDVVHRFKTLTTKRYADGIKQSGWTPFHRRVWQRNYYEHVIRDGESLDRIRQYIINNPVRWAVHGEHPRV